MMSDINITTSIAQMPNLQNVAGAQAAHPEAQQIFAAQMAQQTLKEEAQQVQKVEKQEGSDAIKDEDEQQAGRRRREAAMLGRKAKKREPEEEEQPATSSPWLGHLVNRKV